MLTMTSLAAQLIPELENLLDATLELEASFAEAIASAAPQHRDSARNLLHYLGLRQHDIRDIQNRLSLLGLSRLGRAEAHVCGAIEAVLAALHALAGSAAPPLRASSCPIPSGSMHLKAHAEALLGAPGTTRATRIMVTLPSEAAADPAIIDGLLGAGMDVMRINCAHDDIDAWRAMIGHLRTAELKHGRRCRVYADLAGPKLRTGNLPSLGGMIEFKARRDTWGQVLQPASIWLTSSEQAEVPAVPVDAVLPISQELLDAIHVGDHLDVDDTRGNRRHLAIKERFGGAWLAHCFQHAYVRSGANCGLYRDDTLLLSGNVGTLPEVTQPLLLKTGDRLRLLPPEQIGAPAEIGAHGEVIRPAAIPCSLAAVFDAARAGEPIWFDDGKIGGRIERNDGREIIVEITQAGPNGSKLRPEKGINLPETELAVPAITDDDLRHLGQLAEHIDIIGLSFVRRAEDVLNLHAELERIGAEHLGTVLKIETRQGFENLPHILLASLRRPPVGIMVARGDLAVEIGFERLAEVQEEILWLCEAAHVPVIWATQVLDTMARRGMPSRAEVSDAALSDRAECVMLNKGPFIVDTVRFLDDILTRMNAHRAKGRPMLRKLSVSAIQAVPA
jgi:pyruvate kinase